jgi:hypothetical protein
MTASTAISMETKKPRPPAAGKVRCDGLAAGCTADTPEGRTADPIVLIGVLIGGPIGVTPAAVPIGLCGRSTAEALLCTDTGRGGPSTAGAGVCAAGAPGC